MSLIWVLIVLECAKSSILPNGNFREFFLWRGGGILRFQNGNSRWPWYRWSSSVSGTRNYIADWHISPTAAIIYSTVKSAKFGLDFWPPIFATRLCSALVSKLSNIFMICKTCIVRDIRLNIDSEISPTLVSPLIFTGREFKKYKIWYFRPSSFEM